MHPTVILLDLLGLVISINVDSKYYFYINLNDFDFDKLNGLQVSETW